jgi:hypothetical protein
MAAKFDISKDKSGKFRFHLPRLHRPAARRHFRRPGG